MPAPGDQYHSANIKNPFEERTVNPFTAVEIATLQCRLNKQLGPEYISHRQGAGGGKVAYLEGTKAITLANDVFGFNGWSSSLQQVQIDYVDEAPNGRISLGLSIITRVTLKDGTYHEDIGYGTIENCKGKGAAFEKAKKEAATDGLKRALRNFGNVLGNCLYDKEYLKKVGNMKVKPVKFDEKKLHRHPAYRTSEEVNEEVKMVKREEQQTPMRNGGVPRTNTEQTVASGASMSMEFEDEFGGNLFDGVEISEHHGEEFTFGTLSTTEGSTLRRAEPPKPSGIGNGVSLQQQGSGTNNQSMPSRRPTETMQPPPQLHQQIQGPPRPVPPPNGRGPQTPGPQQRPRGPPTTVDNHAPQSHPQRQQNQPLRPVSLPAQQPNQAPHNPIPSPKPGGPAQPSIANRPPTGFVTSRAAELMQNSDSNSPLNTNPALAFNPHVESPIPKEQRTPGIDHTRSKKIMREEVGVPPPPPSTEQSMQPPQRPPQTQTQATGFRPVAPQSRTNFVNPNQDAHRKIGMPGSSSMSPLANRGAYKPPSMATTGGIKRPPLADVSNHNGGGEGPEAKKAKLSPDGTENAGTVIPPQQ